MSSVLPECVKTWLWGSLLCNGRSVGICIWGLVALPLLLLLLSRFSHVPTLCNPIDGSPPGSPIPGILQATTPEWVAISFSSAWKWKVKVKTLSHIWLLATPWTAAYQAPLSMGFSRQEHWSGLPLPSPVLLLVPVQVLANKRVFANSWNNSISLKIFHKITQSKNNLSALVWICSRLYYDP